MNAHAPFQRALDTIINKYTWKACLVYLDDIINSSKNNDQHFKEFKKFLFAFEAVEMLVMMNKCPWFTTSVKYLGRPITMHKISKTEAHTKSLKDMEHLGTLTELYSFLGMCTVYHWFVSDYSRIAASLNQLLKKDSRETYHRWTMSPTSR